MKMYVIEDQIHAEWIGKYENLVDAIEELRRLSRLSWDEDKNRAPCTSWKTCGREYLLIEYDVDNDPWIELNQEEIFDIRSSGTVFHKNPYFL